MSEMRILEKKRRSRMRLTPERRLNEAVKYLSLLAKEFLEPIASFSSMIRSLPAAFCYLK